MSKSKSKNVITMSEKDELALRLYGIKWSECSDGERAQVEAESITNGGGALDSREMSENLSGDNSRGGGAHIEDNTPEKNVFSESAELENIFKILEAQESSSKAQVHNLERIGEYMNSIEVHELLGDCKNVEEYMRKEFSASAITMRLRILSPEMSEEEAQVRGVYEAEWLEAHLKKSKEVFKALKWLRNNRLSESENGEDVELLSELELENIKDEALSECSRILSKNGGGEALLKALKEDGAQALKVLKLRALKSELNGGSGSGNRGGSGTEAKYKSLLALILAQVEVLDSEEVGEPFGELIDWLEDNEEEALKEARARAQAQEESESENK